VCLKTQTTENIQNQMSNNLDQKIGQTPRVARLLAGALLLSCAFSTATYAEAQGLATPATPTLITPPIGFSAFAVGKAEGTQGYICLPTSTGAPTAAWTVKPARPEATLFQGFGRDFQIITHFLSPVTNPNDVAPKPIPFGNATWQSSFDSSKVWAAVLNGNTILGGSHSSCPNTNAIACLLLEAIGSEEGPTGGTFLSKTKFVQRLNTEGGLAPETGCSQAGDVGKQVLVPYTADYYFFRKVK
jgi:hypothetical protein